MRSPNIVLVHCHDLGRFLSCYGMPAVPSDHLDALAGQSVVFDRAFATAPLCTPARGSLFTGQSPHVNGLMGLAHHGWRYRREVVTLPELMARHGYHTALVGLQHADPTVLGFDEVCGLGFLPRAHPVADEAEAWLRHRGGQDAPFFLTVGMWEAHRPWRAEDYTFSDPAAVDVPAFLPDNPHTRQDLAGFYGAIRQLDEAVGQVLDAVDRNCDPDHTAVLFTTDHGAALPRAKGTLYDPGVEVALIVRPPASWSVLPGRRGQLVSHLDVVPTCLDLAGATSAPGREGRSLVPHLLGSAGNAERTLFFEKTFHDGYDPMRAVRTDRFKYIRNFADGPLLRLSQDLEDSLTRQGMGDDHLAPRPAVELYDLADDPSERHNVAAEPAMSATVAALDAALTDWMSRTADPLLDGVVDEPRPPSRHDDAHPGLPPSGHTPAQPERPGPSS